MRVQAALKQPLLLSPYEMMYGRPFLTSDLFSDEDTNAFLLLLLLSQFSRV